MSFITLIRGKKVALVGPAQYMTGLNQHIDINLDKFIVL